MNSTATMKEKLKQLLMILIPILVTQLGLFGMNFFDTVMSGHAGNDDLAGVAIGSSIWLPVFTGINGILLALTPMISQDLGAKRIKDIPFTVIQGLYLAIALSVVVFIAGFFFLDSILEMMSLTDEVRHIAKHYLIGLSIGIPALFMNSVTRSFIDSLGKTKVSMMITLLALPVNVLFNYIIIFGKFGAPQLGGIGAGYATAITYWLIFLLSVVFIMKIHPFVEYDIFKKYFPISIKAWKEMLFLGLPMGLTIFFETSIFAIVTLLMSQFDTNTIAAHQAALNFASMIYMLPLSISFALTITVGFEVGAKRFRDAKEYSYIGISIAILFALVAAIVLYFTRGSVASMYTGDADVTKLVTQFLVYAIFFQLSDAFVTPINGVLRGHKDVNIPFVIAFTAFWIIGLPSGYLFANYSALGPFGYWVGLIIGLGSGAVALIFRLVVVSRRVSVVNM
ncbi:MAG TPA: MATE family efflux transporter [Bacilli bacterium]|nr:MATE family efflux transporter [Bacilli bacterium]